MIISSSFSYLLFHWRCFNVSLFPQCSIVVLRCSAVFRLFRWCSVVPALFRRSAGVPCSGGVPLFRRWSVVQRVFHVPVVFRCSGVVPSFRGCSAFRCSWFYSMSWLMWLLQTNFSWAAVKMSCYVDSLAGKAAKKIFSNSGATVSTYPLCWCNRLWLMKLVSS